MLGIVVSVVIVKTPQSSFRVFYASGTTGLKGGSRGSRLLPPDYFKRLPRESKRWVKSLAQTLLLLA